jgi:CubicO group peptidase (beta-lactamase class C family)
MAQADIPPTLGASSSQDLMTGSPPFGPDRLVALDDHWQDGPANRWSFQHVRELIPTARIRRGSGPVWQLPRDEHDIGGLEVTMDDQVTTVGELLDATQTDGFLVIHRGRIVMEKYFNQMAEDTPHLLQSVSKSITGAVAGSLVGRGLLDVNARLGEVVVELSKTSFGDATVQQLLDMRTGTRFNEDYGNLDADISDCEQVYLWRPRVDPALPDDALSYFATLPNDGEHGGPFRYRSILTDVMAWVIERAGGARFHELVSREVWSPMGAEFDAEVTIDAHGNALADGGICATLRDLGRFGLLYLQGGRRGSEQIVSNEWVRDTVQGAADGPAAFAAGDEERDFPPGAHYRNYWWVRDPVGPFLIAAGIYGQNIYVHGPTQTVMVKLSTWPEPLDQSAIDATREAVVIIGEHLERSGG